MASFMDFMQKNGLYIGLAFTAVVVGLLVYLHLFATPVVPQPRHQATKSPDVLVCEGEVPWVTDAVVEKAREFWKQHGHSLGPTKRVPCGSLGQCSTSNNRTMPCSRGNIVVTLRDQAFEEDHLGETVSVFDKETGLVDWSTILLPSELMEPMPPLEEEFAAAPTFPLDVEGLVFAHEVGHWFGYDHVSTPLPGPFFAEPTGHLMTRSVFKQGWGDAGLSGGQ